MESALKDHQLLTRDPVPARDVAHFHSTRENLKACGLFASDNPDLPKDIAQSIENRNTSDHVFNAWNLS